MPPAAFPQNGSDRAHLLAADELRDIARLLIECIGVPAEDRNIALARFGERHLHDFDAAAVEHREREVVDAAEAERRNLQLARDWPSPFSANRPRS